MTTDNTTFDAVRAFLDALIDDASLFPPERADMVTAVERHLSQRHSDVGWLQGHFVCPASRLDELVDHLPEPCPEWPTTAILDGTGTATDTESWGERLRDDLSLCAGLVTGTNERVRVESVELALPSDGPADAAECANLLAQALEVTPGITTAFLEIPRSEDWTTRMPAVVEVIAARRADLVDRGMTAPGAKMRCGGLVAESFPSVEEVAAFLRACVASELPLKCTAGLHHPLPTSDPSTGAHMHGFLGVFGAALLLWAEEVGAEAVEQIVAESDPGKLFLDPAGLRWGDHRVDGPTIAVGRRSMVVGFGSCSLAEPVADLVDLGMLHASAADSLRS